MRSLTRVISKQESGQLLSETQDTCYYCLCINFALYFDAGCMWYWSLITEPRFLLGEECEFVLFLQDI